MRRIIAALVTIGALAVPATSQAYLHVENARAQCYNETAQDAANRGTPYWAGHLGYLRYNSRDVGVSLMWSAGNGWVTTYDCRYIGDDGYGNPNWVVNISFRWVYPPCGTYYAPTNTQRCYSY